MRNRRQEKGAHAEIDTHPLQVYFADKVVHMWRRFLAYLILFLCISVTTREVPECMALADDVSNDGDVAVYNLQPPLSVSSRADAPGQPEASALGKGSHSLPFLSPRFSQAAAPLGLAGVDLLRLIDQQRR